ncbi:MAG: NTP transferase domain-containing protein, partial [Anaerolineales bacterium]|nr:NTP transferase domain-containing protein [Anaerolineales bacterium]
TDEHVHHAEIFSHLSGLQIGETITPQAVISMLTHPQGGLKNIPPIARRIALLNQADTPELRSIAGGMAPQLLVHFHSVVVGSFEQNIFHTFEQTAGIILAAGESTRFGSPKQLLDWKGKPFVRHIAETALHSGLWPVVVITGFCAAEVESCLKDLPVHNVHNPAYKQGQSASIKAGINFLFPSPKFDGNSVEFGGGRVEVGSAIFLLADQPQIPSDVMRALTESHARELQPIIAPLVLEGRRANPVLFDQVTFPDLLHLTGDIGGRAIFSKYKVEYIPWHDDILLLDVDKPEDYQRLVEIEKL